MKVETIQLIKTGWYHPSNANWSYEIFMLIDATGAKLYYSTFGGDSRLANSFAGKVERLSVYESAQYKARDLKSMTDIEKYNGKNY